jgi:hypothetical protein
MERIGKTLEFSPIWFSPIDCKWCLDDCQSVHNLTIDLFEMCLKNQNHSAKSFFNIKSFCFDGFEFWCLIYESLNSKSLGLVVAACFDAQQFTVDRFLTWPMNF